MAPGLLVVPGHVEEWCSRGTLPKMLPEGSAWFETQQELRAPVLTLTQQLVGRRTGGLARQPELGRAPGPSLEVCQWHGGCVHFFPGWGQEEMEES